MPQHRFRFTLRTLFAVSVMIAILVAWFGLEMRSRQLQTQAIQAIGTRGGFVWYDRAERNTEVVFTPQPGKGCGQVIRINSVVNSTRSFSDQDLNLLAHLRWLRNVDFTGSQVSLAAIEQFRQSHPMCEVKP